MLVIPWTWGPAVFHFLTPGAVVLAESSKCFYSSQQSRMSADEGGRLELPPASRPPSIAFHFIYLSSGKLCVCAVVAGVKRFLTKKQLFSCVPERIQKVLDPAFTSKSLHLKFLARRKEASNSTLCANRETANGRWSNGGWGGWGPRGMLVSDNQASLEV